MGPGHQVPTVEADRGTAVGAKAAGQYLDADTMKARTEVADTTRSQGGN